MEPAVLTEAVEPTAKAKKKSIDRTRLDSSKQRKAIEAYDKLELGA